MPIESKAALEFQATRRRTDARCDYPISGFGLEGDYILWLPTPAMATRTKFVDGEPALETVGQCFDDPVLAEAREQVLKTLVRTGPTSLSVDIAFLKYAANVMKRNYDLSDDDLSMLLSGTAWQDAMMRHLLGGDDMIDAVIQHAPALFERTREDIRQRENYAAPNPPIVPMRRRRHWWKRWFGLASG